MPGKPINKNVRSSKDNTNVVTGENNNSKIRTRGGFVKNVQKDIGRTNNNDYDGTIGNVNNNDFDGIGSTETTSTKEANTTNGVTYDNILHQYATYNTLFTLSGLNENEMRSHDYLDNAPHDIIARTGGIGEPNVTQREVDTQTVGDDDELGGPMERTVQENKFSSKYDDSIQILQEGHDLFIENVNIISTGNPNAERNLGNFTRMEFEIHEPFGITLLEKMRACAALNKYRDYQDCPFLFTIEFRGQDENGQMYKVSSVRKIPVLITKVDFDVNEGGAQYTVTAVPYTDLAYDDRFKFPRTTIAVNINNPLEWAEQVSVDIDAGMQDEIDEKPPRREFKDTYEFIIHPDVIAKGQAYKNETQTIHNSARVGGGRLGNRGKAPTPKNANTSVSDGIALTKYFEDAIRSAYGYQQLAENFWTAYLRMSGVEEERLKTTESVSSIVQSAEITDILLKNQFVDWFKIKTTVETDTSRLDSVTHMHPKHIIYQAIPFKIHVLKLIGPGMGLKDVDYSKYVHKRYNYLYTGENIDVQNLRINYKTAFFYRNVRSKADTNANQGIFSHVEQAFKSVFGTDRDPEPILPLRQYPSTIRGKSTVGTKSAEGDKAQQFYDYLTNPEADMVRLEMEILGDPAYISEDMYSPIHANRTSTLGGKNRSWNTSRQSFNADQYMPMIQLTYRLPDDIDELEGTSFSGKRKFRREQLFFSGIYQLNKVESSFKQGQFTQTLFCTRMNNQSGASENFNLVRAAAKDTAMIANIDLEEAAKKKAEKEARKFESRQKGLGAFDGP